MCPITFSVDSTINAPRLASSLVPANPCSLVLALELVEFLAPFESFPSRCLASGGVPLQARPNQALVQLHRAKVAPTSSLATPQSWVSEPRSLLTLRCMMLMSFLVGLAIVRNCFCRALAWCSWPRLLPLLFRRPLGSGKVSLWTSLASWAWCSL